MIGAEKQLRDELLDWAKPFPPLFGVTAMIAAKSAGSLHLAVEWAIEGYPVDLPITTYNEARFSGYYSRPHLLAAELLCVGADWEEVEQAERTLALLPRLMTRQLRQSLNSCPIACLITSMKISRAVVEEQLREVASDIVRPGWNDWGDLLHPEFVEHPAFAFLVQIAAPHWLLYGMWPQEAFRLASRAERPSFSSLKNLVRLDPKLLHHPDLRSVLHPERVLLRRSRQHEVGKVFGTPPAVPSLRTVKRKLVALISRLSELFQPKRIKPKQLKRLFDLVARTPHPLTDASRLCLLGDADVLDGDPLRSAIRQHGPNWRLPPKPDSDYFSAVRTLARAAA